MTVEEFASALVAKIESRICGRPGRDFYEERTDYEIRCAKAEAIRDVLEALAEDIKEILL